ncbi:MAG: 2-oxoacid:ferredoxin oxidoreductase subunit alpha [Omnitrophica bacterium RIFCSPLOWO2_12_FULL_44_17]|uniref:2-oxoacid:ferredoxin oxidoreductase subunit alpha n=1 Tax=Candidatus Danuiimicrobium aquiferis TaxID=1801832 RepID=A0A1G1KZH5_9BACT|nr:MAG: 2-oxoacid:ferredoxin oxidoreductase subunit alpha [Omnitrophica bacterium RIFCSPHIGHO2_02_FULL_45_28]OGW89114.1 MAG: 2-oxoacid:ferredoxin oxidoreductase subunit alpha [Omnitrophica bacterium RIFCSPHIGHO2_12_FULL_44_12]OGW98297.1 MAG: 2-oxoacid:ferredoxin oxidoreductase subunit alpha [Omnitrophica bacterium RIFCSPLOWO2_12_FULL_44_17]OGX02891.1 MAG: 2-oxoacid:ferredoxin oxidoreductase subunit alpha [Omnitrophica bacterium RIFCSPLOWO2_02_FULL_44_11]
MNQPEQFTDDLSIVICGEAGQGVQTIQVVLIQVLRLAGYYAFATPEFMSRIRGGSNSTEIRVSSQRIGSFVEKIDFLIPLDRKAISHLDWRISNHTFIIGDQGQLGTEKPVYDIQFQKIAKEIGGDIYFNIIAAGFIIGVFNIDQNLFTNFLKAFFKEKSAEIIEKNCSAGFRGWNLGREFCASRGISISIQQHEDMRNEFFLNGAEAVGLGAIAGGCNFISAYPMSPSTGVLVFLAEQAEKFGIVVEQAEDEISGMNMALGSWYAGGRALVSTSGGGFALMTEGLSLAGCIESPVVVHLAQRPGPATGLPTRTEQGDLELALYAGHGEFPRVIYAPGTIQDAFFCTRKAFEIADRYQIPVFILTDQFLMDSYFSIPLLDFPKDQPLNHIVQTEENYKRYQLTENGISPRGIPGFGRGIVCVDSDEHDEGGYITEDFRVRKSMVDKRLRKEKFLAREILAPELIGDENFKKLVVGWGSTYSVICEALERRGDAQVAFLYCKQIYPLPSEVEMYLKKAKETIVVENNATGQFAKLIKRETGISVTRKILKYDGFPFSVEKIEEAL